MIKQIITLFSACILVIALQAQDRLLVKGMKINKRTKIKKGVYLISSVNNMEQSVILIEGSNIIVDFNNAILNGSKLTKSPDEFAGVGIIIRDSKNVMIKNLKAKGYKVALLAKNTEGLVLDNCDFSYNYRQHLNSTQEKEDVTDWMSYHHNEKDEWLRYGAAMYLRNCNSVVVKNCRVTGGQNALMMMECNDGMIYNNDFSFNSGIGLGMYRCSRNKVMYNKINFNVRGYSHGVYNRGQDSAGILGYEQSNNNFFYKNSATHSGDGFFLWAGQTTMDNGQGGCNDNVIMGNNFSYAPANGIETTFSRNIITDNRIFECDYGIWGGYSYESNISGNKFKDNRIDIAIEHGKQNKITYNIFYESKEAIKLWARAEQSADWGYTKYSDTKSHDYIIAFNNFNNCQTVLTASHTSKIDFFSNVFGTYDQLFKIDSTVTDIDTTINQELYDELSVDTVTSILE
ncbi:MAG: right-handed parallel beta-helix repeat-containing protein, partial [Bacteroidia bacterium]|nr:right-handed parallel beta-helix repeat-containing protein [Bacteroidia bacterium]